MAHDKAVAINGESKIAGEQERQVEEEEKIVSAQAVSVKVIKDQVEAQLEEARPAMLQAEAALGVLDDKDLNEVRGFPNPPEVVKMTLEAVLIYLQSAKTDWPAAKKLMGDNFKSKLLECKAEKLSEAVLKKVRVIITK
jgi:dynein heavy chain, axonemal